MERWSGRVAIVTGTSSGIGVGIAKVLVENGMKVVGVARRVERVKQLSDELRGCKGELHPMQCDITSEEDVVRVVRWTRENLGGADVLVNNAGVGNRMSFSDMDVASFHRVFNTNVLGLCVFSREMIRDLRERGVDDGHIFNINSTFGQRICDVPDSFFYQASKHSVTILTEGMRRELRDLKTNIKVTSLSPGLVRSEVAVADGRLTLEENEIRHQVYPCLEPHDIANGLIYALSTPPNVQVHELLIQPVGQFP